MSEAASIREINIDPAALAGSVEFLRAFVREDGHRVVCMFDLPALTGTPEETRFAVGVVLADFARQCAHELARQHRKPIATMLRAIIQAAAAELSAKHELSSEGTGAAA